MTKIVNRAKMTTATTGTGSISLGSAVGGYQTFADAGVGNGDVVRYVIEDGTAWEIGTGTYSSTGPTLTRSVTESSNADAAISLSGNAVVYVALSAAETIQKGDNVSDLTNDAGYITGNQTISLSGDLSGSGTTSINAQIASNAVGANELNVTGNGTATQYLRSDGDGSFTWATPPDTNTTYSAGSGIGLTGTTFSVSAGGGLTQEASGLAHADTSAQGSLTALTGANVVSDIDLDTYGHVTSLSTRAMTAADLGAITGNQTITLSGDVSGSGTTSIVVTVADDSHNHIIANVDGLQAALDGKLSTSGKAADSNLLDGIDSSQFLRSDASDQYYRISQTPHGNPTNNLGAPSVTEMALFQEQFDNKTAFYDINYLKFYTSTDGTNWTEYTSFSDDNKRKFVGGDYSSGIKIPYNTPHFRIEVANAGSYVYLNALYMYWSGSGNTTTVKIRKQRGDGVWSQHTNSTVAVGSWPGHLYLPFGTIPFNPSTTSTGHYRTVHIDFQPTWSTTYTNPISLYRMQLWGGYPAGKRTHFTVDENKQTIFPSEVYANGSTSYKVFHDAYHPNADKLTTARSISLSGDVTGSANFDGSANISITATVADDSHNHTIANVDGLQTALDGKSATSHNHTLDSLSNTTITSITAGEILKWSGTAWINNTLAEAGIQPAGSYLTGNQTITLSGDLTGSGTTSINAQIAANVVGAAELNVTGNGTTAQYLRSDGDGSFTWATPPDTNTTYSAGNGISLSGTAFSVAAGSGLTQQASGLAHADTSTQASLTALTGANVVSDIDLDGFGHVTALATRAMTAADLGALTANQTITLSGDLSGSGSTSINAQIVANAIGAAELNVVGNGTTSQYLRSDGDGTFTWATPPDTNTTYSAGSGLSLAGTVFSHSDTSAQGSVNNSGATVIQDVTLDTYGHVTGLGSATLTASTIGAAALAGSASQAFSASTLNATTVDLGDWTVTESAGVLYFAYLGTNKMKVDSSGNLTVTGNVTAYGTV